MNVISAKFLSIDGYGLFSLGLAISGFTEIIGNFGVHLTMVRIFNAYDNDSQLQKRILGVVLIFQSVVFIIIAGLSVLISRVLVVFLSVKSNEFWLFALALITGGLYLFWFYILSYYQAQKKFNLFSRYTIILAFLRILLLVIPVILKWYETIIFFLFSNFLPVFTILLIELPKKIPLIKITLTSKEKSLQLLKEVISYSKWVGLSELTYSGMPMVVRIVLGKVSKISEVGIFSAGLTFASVFISLNTILRTFFFPEVSAFKNFQEFKMHFERVKKFFFPFAIGSSIIIGILAGTQLFLLGEDYKKAFPIVLINGFGFATVTFLGLITMLIHTLMKPNVDALTNVFRFLLLIVISIILSEKFGAIGASIAYSTTLILGEFFLLYYVFKKISSTYKSNL